MFGLAPLFDATSIAFADITNLLASIETGSGHVVGLRIALGISWDDLDVAPS